MAQQMAKGFNDNNFLIASKGRGFGSSPTFSPHGRRIEAGCFLTLRLRMKLRMVAELEASVPKDAEFRVSDPHRQRVPGCHTATSALSFGIRTRRPDA